MERVDEPPSTNPPLPGWVWVHIKGGGIGVGGWGKEKALRQGMQRRGKGSLVDCVTADSENLVSTVFFCVGPSAI